MNKYPIIFLAVIISLLISCNNSSQAKKDVVNDTLTSAGSPKQGDAGTIKPPHEKADTLRPHTNEPSVLPESDTIKHYSGYQTPAVKNYVAQLQKEWKRVPNPLTATYEGNDFGDYHHILFKDANGITYDFGQANNSYGSYQLHAASGQYADNPKFLGKRFRVYWAWKLADFLCCEGEYNQAKGYLPTISKLELIKD